MDLKQAILDLLKNISESDYTRKIEFKQTGTFYSVKLNANMFENTLFYLYDCNSDEEFLERLKKDLCEAQLHRIDYYKITKENCNLYDDKRR